MDCANASIEEACWVIFAAAELPRDRVHSYELNGVARQEQEDEHGAAFYLTIAIALRDTDVLEDEAAWRRGWTWRG